MQHRRELVSRWRCVVSRRYSDVELVEVWDRRQTGESNRSISRRLGRSAASIRALVESSGGVRPRRRCRSGGQLSLVEREEISRGLAAGVSIRTIAAGLGRAPSTISRELARNGGRGSYRAHVAEKRAWVRGRRPQVCKLAANPQLRRVVEEKPVCAVVTATDLSVVGCHLPWDRGDAGVSRNDLCHIVHPSPRRLET